MIKFKSVLSNEQIGDIVFPVDWSASKDQQAAHIIAREIEQAVLANLHEQEPCCYKFGDKVYDENPGAVIIIRKGEKTAAGLTAEISVGYSGGSRNIGNYAHQLAAFGVNEIIKMAEGHGGTAKYVGKEVKYEQR